MPLSTIILREQGRLLSPLYTDFEEVYTRSPFNYGDQENGCNNC